MSNSAVSTAKAEGDMINPIARRPSMNSKDLNEIEKK